MMLTRAGRRKVRHNFPRRYVACSEAFQLPFLCPVLYGLQASSSTARTTTTTTARHLGQTWPQRPRALSRCQNPADRTTSARFQRRQLASAATATVTQTALPDDYVPFDNVSPLDARQKWQIPQHLDHPYALPGLDSTSPLVLNSTPTIPEAKFRSVDAISGDLNEIHQTLHACLQVGRLERAQALLRRLNQIYQPDAPGLIAAHNDYIREITLRIMRDKHSSLMKPLHLWFEVDLRQSGVRPNATTYALMIQASARGTNTKAKGRSVRRYLHLAEEAGVHKETLSLVSGLEMAEIALEHAQQDAASIARARSAETRDAPATKATANSTAKTQYLRAVDQKGLGLSTLQKQLAILSGPGAQQEDRSQFMKDIQGDITHLSTRDRQLALERNTVDVALERWQQENDQLKSHGVLNVLSTRSIGALLWRWHQILEPSIALEVQKSKEAEDIEARTNEDEDRLLWGPYLQDISPKKISALTILSCIKSVSLQSKDDRGARVLSVVRAISAAIQEECLSKYTKANQKYRQWRALSREGYERKYGQHLVQGDKHTAPPEGQSDVKSSSSADLDDLEWPSSVRVRIGTALLSQVVEHTKVEVSRKDPKTGVDVREEQPAFFHTFAYIAGKRVGVIRLNPSLTEVMTRAPLSPSLAKHLPMITKPKPWTAFAEGGYLEQSLGVVRLDSTDALAKRYAVAASDNGDMSQVFAGLDVLAQTPWSINQRVFDVMAEAWNTGEAIGKMPPDTPDVAMPPEPPQTASVKDRMKWLRQIKEIENYKGGLKSQRCFWNFQLEVARAFLNETFYYPHNVDFRGRAYPMAPFLNHMGADNARGLLQFAEKKILGPSGLRWLKIHLANVYGFDKASFEERQRFTEDHVDDVIDAANNGIHGNRWWLAAEDPWQCLAACIDLKAALDLPDPTRYRSRLAIHQDGTCNGLQHYAALGGDIAGAKQVNLEPGDRPSDIYTAVAEMIKKDIASDAADGHVLAKHLDGKVTRKVVKQTVMTNVYGVTFIGAKRQVKKQLENILVDFPNEESINKDLAAFYIAKKIFRSLATMFNGAHDIQYWFGDCAGRICNSISPAQIAAIQQEAEGHVQTSIFSRLPVNSGQKSSPHAFTTGVIWTTPLKMPVVQPYAKMQQTQVETAFQKISINSPSMTNPVHRSKQLQAFPPNFIHSLDGTHMFLTALKCDQVGLTFAAVHDSFWTHAGDIDTMNTIIREAFIRMHSENIVDRLRAEFEARYSGHMCLASVHYQSVVGQKIRAWRRSLNAGNINTVHSAQRTKELLREVERQRLLASENPKDREKGAAMMTACSIFDGSTADERVFAVPSDIPAPLGQVTSRGAKLKANEELEVGDLENTEPIEPSIGADESVELAEYDELVDDTDPHDVHDDIEHRADGSDLGLSDASELTGSDIVSKIETHQELSGRSDKKLDASWIRDAEKRKREKTRARGLKSAKTYLWVPLTFPPVPKKGDFDVTRLRESQYFFS